MGSVILSLNTINTLSDRLGRTQDMLQVAAVMKRELVRRHIGKDELPIKSARSKKMGHKTLYEHGSFYKRITYVIENNVALVGIVGATEGGYKDIGRGLQGLFGWLDNYGDDIERVTQAVRAWLFAT